MLECERAKNALYVSNVFAQKASSMSQGRVTVSQFLVLESSRVDYDLTHPYG